MQFDIRAIVRQKAPNAKVPGFVIRWLERITHVKQMNAFLRKYNIARIQPYVTLANFITFTKYSGYDPEVSQNSDATSMGLDFGTYPNIRTVTFGVNVDF